MTEEKEDHDDNVELGADDEQEDVPLEKKYAEQMRQIFPQKIELPVSTLLSMVTSQIELNPSFQRRDVWDQKKQSRFIESLIMNVPIPPIFMGEDNYSKYVVLDGRQRLTAIVKYLKNEYELKNLTVWSELNGKRFSDLAEMELDVTITRRFLPAVLLRRESSPEVKYDVFERLNTGGLNLNAMEIRNAIYRGRFTDLLHKCTEVRAFQQLWGIPESGTERKSHKIYERMTDLELALRFFALGDAQRDPAKPKRPAFKTYLGIYMQKRNTELEENEAAVTQEFNRFKKAAENCVTILGKEAFRPLNKKDRSAPFADAIMYGLADVDLGKLDLKVVQDKVKAAVRILQERNATFKAAMASGTNGKTKIEARLHEARAAIETAINSIT